MDKNNLNGFNMKDFTAVPDSFDLFNEEEMKNWLGEERKNTILDKNNPEATKKHLGLLINATTMANLDEKFAELFNDYFSNKTIIVDILNNASFTTEQFNNILKIYKKLSENNNGIVFSEGYNTYYDVDEVHAANVKINSWVDKINSQKIDGKELSPLEKFYLAYNIITEFEFKESSAVFDARNVISVLNGDKIVCVGYSQLLSELCKKLGIECETQLVCYHNEKPNHMTCKVRLKDEKYGIDGVFYSDPTWDSKKNGTKTINNMLLTYRELPVLYGNSLKLAKKLTAMNYLVIDEKFKSIKTREEWQKVIAEFMATGKDEFSKYLDSTFESRKGEGDAKVTPTKEQLQEIIDLYFTGVLSSKKSMEKYAGMPTSGMLGVIDIHKMIIGKLLNTYADTESYPELKEQLMAEIETYCPKIASKTFDDLRKIYAFEDRKKNTELFEKMKMTTKHLEFSQFLKLVKNIKKLSPLNPLETEIEMNELFRNSYAKAYGAWKNGENGLNPFSKLIYCGKNRKSVNKVPVASYIEDFYDSLFDITSIFGNLLADEEEEETKNKTKIEQNEPGE